MGIRELLRTISVALRWGGSLDTHSSVTDDPNSFQDDDDKMYTFELRLSVPLNGFQRMNVSRLVLTFGRLQEVAPVRLGIFLQHVQE